MPTQAKTDQVTDSVPKIDGRIAVGEDLEFQRKWWKFERVIWIVFFFILMADLLGLFGRGWLSKGKAVDSAQTLKLDYERIARASTPSIMTFHFGPGSIENGHIQMYVSNTLVKELGAQRISPQPASSTIGEDGITYAFDATQLPATVQISLEPSFPGLHHFRVRVVGGEPIEKTIVVVP